MNHPLFPLAVVMRRVPVKNRWISEKWELSAVEPDARVDQISCAEIAEQAWRWRGFALDLHPSEAEGYYLNLTAPDPRVFVMWRLEEWQGVETARPWVTTASYHEAARMLDAGETVDSLPIPDAVRAWIQPWVDANYKPEARRKNRRNEKFWGEGNSAEKPPNAIGGERDR